MMFRPSHPRVMNYRPRVHPQQDFQWRSHLGPRDFHGKNLFRPRPPHITENNILEHWCETCDRGFPTAKHLDDHKLQHQKCNIDGCQFVAHPKVITKHIQMQHSSGLYKKISKLNNPEEIKKWIEERKKNFPTRSNIEKKAAELKEKIERGEKMGLKQGQRFRESKPDNKRKLDPSYKCHNDKNFKKKKICNEKNETEIKDKPTNLRNTIKYLPPVEDKIRITPFSGIQELMIRTQVEDDANETNDNLLIEDDDCEVVIKDSQGTNTSEPVLCGALLTLMGQYGSSDEEENSESNSHQALTKIKEINKTKDKSDSIENKKKDIAPTPSTSCDINTINDDDDNDSCPEEAKVLKNVEEKDNESTQKETAKNVKKKPIDKSDNKHMYFRKQKSKLPSTLLQKLLSREMQHERNMILQCVRYIIKNNYFDK